MTLLSLGMSDVFDIHTAVEEDVLGPYRATVDPGMTGFKGAHGGYLMALAQLQLLARHTVAFFADYDLLLTPVLAARPLEKR